jgi:hypothetical protein
MFTIMGKSPTQLRRPALASTLAAWLVVTALAGCAGDGGIPTSDGGDGGSGGASFTTIQQEIFASDCTSSACHSSATRAGGMSLVAGDAYEALVNVAPDNPVARAAGLLRVKPDDPTHSFLIDKLTGMLDAGEGSAMPLGGIPLRADQIEMIRTWIANGAMPDGASG